MTTTAHTLARALTAAGSPSHVVTGAGGRAFVTADPPVDIPDEPYPTPGGPDAPEWRICPTCGATMERYGVVDVCPTARTEARSISDDLRQRGRGLTEQRIEGLPF